MLRRFLLTVVLLLSGVLVILLGIAPRPLVNEVNPPELSGDLTEWVASREKHSSETRPIIASTEKRIRWYQGRKNTKAPFSVVYLHGFSATRQEIAPVGELIADGLEANLFETRLTGHGQLNNQLEDVRAEDWLADAAEALTIGAELGRKVILMGTSNGAALALAMKDHPTFQPVGFVVLLSPNFGPKDSNSDFLTWPGGPQLAQLMLGETRSWKPHNKLQALYWSTSYPTDALVEVMRLVKYVRGKQPLNLGQSVLMIYSPLDSVVDTSRIVSAFDEMQSPGKQLITIPASGDSSNHVLAGNIMAPENNRNIADSVVRFVNENLAFQQ